MSNKDDKNKNDQMRKFMIFLTRSGDCDCDICRNYRKQSQYPSPGRELASIINALMGVTDPLFEKALKAKTSKLKKKKDADPKVSKEAATKAIQDIEEFFKTNKKGQGQ